MGLFLDLTPQKTRGAKARGALKETGWSNERVTHTQGGKPILPIVHTVYLELLNHNIEDIFLSKHIYPGARLCHPKQGPGTVLTCSLRKPYHFCWLPDSELEIEEEGTLQISFYDPLKLHPGWQFPVRGCEEWQPLQVDADEEVIKLTSSQREMLAYFCADASTWQLGLAAQWIIKELKEKMK